MPRIMNFSTQHLSNVFSNDGTENTYDYDAVRNLMFDLATGEDIFDEDGNKVSKREANDKLRKVVYAILELSENPTKRDRKRAFKKHGTELFEIIEEVVDMVVETGFHENEFFNDYVEYRNIAAGDDVEFWTDEKIVLSIARVSGSHHDFILQRPAEGQPYTIPLSRYGAAVGADIDRYLVGQEDWATLVGMIGKAFTIKIQNEIFSQMMNAYKKITPQAQFVGNGTLGASTKDAFDEIISNVQMANEAPVVIMGTKLALKKISALSDVDWRAEIQKEDVARMGRLGSYEGTTLFELPQRFELNDITKKLVDDDILLIMPAVDNKFVKFIDQGETEIDEITQKGEEHGRIDDVMKYEVQRSFGTAVQIGRYFGAWTLA